jgi:hypothetical protein
MVNLLPLAEKQQRQRGSGQLSQARDSSQGSGLFQLFAKEVDDSLTWDFIPWLRTITKLPIYVKVKDGAGGGLQGRRSTSFGTDPSSMQSPVSDMHRGAWVNLCKTSRGDCCCVQTRC